MRATTRHRQQGVIAVLTGIMIAMMIGFLGIVVDLGRLYVIKSELQTGMDACSLAAASQLRPGLNDPSVFDNVEAFGRTMSDETKTGTSGARPGVSVNRADFQGNSIDPQVIQFEYAASLAGPYNSRSFIAPGDARFVRCTYPMSNIQLWVMPALRAVGIASPETAVVAAAAVATLAPSQHSCSFPVGLCRAPGTSAASTPPWGLVRGQWSVGLDDPNAGSFGTGNFGFLDFSPPAGGAPELSQSIIGTGSCTIQVGTPVGATGVTASLRGAWNSRFGLYYNGGGAGGGTPINATTAPPDRTGFAYTPQTWGPGGNAYAGADRTSSRVITTGNGNNASSTPSTLLMRNYQRSRAAGTPYQGDLESGIAAGANTITNTPPRDRRLVQVPIIDCGVWNTNPNGNPPVEGWACALLLHPITNPGGGSFTARIEYLGLSSEPNSPCATNGLAGGTNGPLVPVLAQ